MEISITDKPMTSIKDSILLAVMTVSNVGAWLPDISAMLRIIFSIVAALTTIMAFMNQFKTLQKNYRTLWVVVKVTHVFTLLNSKKIPQRGIVIRRQKNKSKINNDGTSNTNTNNIS